MAKKQPNKQEKNAPASLIPFLSSTLDRPYTGALLAGIYGVVMLVVGLTYHLVGDYNVETDFFQSYVPMAKDILRGIWTIEEYRGPGYPMVLAAAGGLIGNYFTAGIIVSTITASLTLFFIFGTLRRLFRADVAFVVVLLTAVNWTFVQYSYTAGTDMTFNCFLSMAVYFLFRSPSVSFVDLAVAAVASAAAYLTRYNGVVVIVAVPLLIVLLNIYGLELRRRWYAAGAFLAVFFLAITPWGIHCLQEKGTFFYNKNYLNIAYEMYAKGKIGWDQYWNVESSKYHSLGQVILSDPGLFVRTVLGNIFEHGKNDLLQLVGWPVGVLAVFGLFGLWEDRMNLRRMAYFLFGALMFGVLLLVFYGERFSMFLIPMYTTIAVAGMPWEKWKNIPFVRPMILLPVVLVLTAVKSYDFNSGNIDSGPKEIKVIADWFNANVKDADPDKIIVCRKPHIAFYMNKTMKYFPYVTGWEALEKETKALHASYMFYGIFEANMRPEFQRLLDPRNAPPWLEPVTYTTNPPSVLYRVKE